MEPVAWAYWFKMCLVEKTICMVLLIIGQTNLLQYFVHSKISAKGGKTKTFHVITYLTFNPKLLHGRLYSPYQSAVVE